MYTIARGGKGVMRGCLEVDVLGLVPRLIYCNQWSWRNPPDWSVAGCVADDKYP